LKSTFNSWYDKKARATDELSAETDEVSVLLREIKKIAVVGISRNPQKDSFFVARYLNKDGYTVFPVNPGADEIMGLKCYPDLASIPEEVDVVDVFRAPDDIPAVVEEALKINPKVIWLQLGTGDHPDQKKRAESKGVKLIQNRCIKADHQFLVRDQAG
jgi:predicted CoA-binding protein